MLHTGILWVLNTLHSLHLLIIMSHVIFCFRFVSVSFTALCTLSYYGVLGVLFFYQLYSVLSINSESSV